MSRIHFFEEAVSFNLQHRAAIAEWLTSIATQEGYMLEEINYIFCSDDYLLQINKEYLNHDYYTDIITFDHSSQSRHITSDIFISIDRVHENAHDLNTPFEQELHRVMVHGLLHLLGYGDSTEDEKILMRRKEDACLSLLK